MKHHCCRKCGHQRLNYSASNCWWNFQPFYCHYCRLDLRVHTHHWYARDEKYRVFFMCCKCYRRTRLRPAKVVIEEIGSEL